MVKLTKIYTRTGDDGTTGLADGTRRAKHDLRSACYGTIDEANAALGLARTALEEKSELSDVILRLQNDFFDLGADLATPDPDMEGALRITDDQ
ncbi:MAG: ATP:cob(I)alamin adenosyltransferase, partial [Pseudomonadota bacterium]|nr:ATP:cob(I)alamin adenosyltransferase [Pseudomonadota bacterium]